MEKGQAPKRVIASHITAGAVDRTRPLCVYPKVAVYTGSGSTDDAAIFKCRNPRGERYDDWDCDDGNTTTAITTTELKNRILLPHYPGDADGPSRFFFGKHNASFTSNVEANSLTFKEVSFSGEFPGIVPFAFRLDAAGREEQTDLGKTSSWGGGVSMSSRVAVFLLACFALIPLDAAAWDRGNVERFAALPAGSPNPEGITDEHGNVSVCANQSDEIVVVDTTGRAIARLGDFDGVRNGSPVGLLFPASLARHGDWIYITNLSLDLRPITGQRSVDSQWAAEVKRHTVARIRARIPGINGGDD